MKTQRDAAERCTSQRRANHALCFLSARCDADLCQIKFNNYPAEWTALISVPITHRKVFNPSELKNSSAFPGVPLSESGRLKFRGIRHYSLVSRAGKFSFVFYLLCPHVPQWNLAWTLGINVYRFENSPHLISLPKCCGLTKNSGHALLCPLPAHAPERCAPQPGTHGEIIARSTNLGQSNL